MPLTCIFLARPLLSALMRLFTAVWPARAVVEKLAAIQHDDRFRWLRPESFHVTLCFYGSLSDENATALKKELAQVRSPLLIAVAGPLTQVLKKQLIYVPVRGVEPLAHKLGVDKFMGHITLARSKHPIRNYEPVAVNGSWEIDSFTLTQSHTLPEGAVYETMETYRLGT